MCVYELSAEPSFLVSLPFLPLLLHWSGEPWQNAGNKRDEEFVALTVLGCSQKAKAEGALGSSRPR